MTERYEAVVVVGIVGYHLAGRGTRNPSERSLGPYSGRLVADSVVDDAASVPESVAVGRFGGAEK